VAFSEVFGLKPWDVDRLTYEQFHAYKDRTDQLRGG